MMMIIEMTAWTSYIALLCSKHGALILIHSCSPTEEPAGGAESIGPETSPRSPAIGDLVSDVSDSNAAPRIVKTVTALGKGRTPYSLAAECERKGRASNGQITLNGLAQKNHRSTVSLVLFLLVFSSSSSSSSSSLSSSSSPLFLFSCTFVELPIEYEAVCLVTSFCHIHLLIKLVAPHHSFGAVPYTRWSRHFCDEFTPLHNQFSRSDTEDTGASPRRVFRACRVNYTLPAQGCTVSHYNTTYMP